MLLLGEHLLLTCIVHVPHFSKAITWGHTWDTFTVISLLMLLFIE